MSNGGALNSEQRNNPPGPLARQDYSVGRGTRAFGARSKHGCVHAVRRIVAVEEGVDVDDHLLAHVEAALKRRRAKVRKNHNLVVLQELRD